MRAKTLLVALPIVLLGARANADSFVDIEGGITAPLGDDNWNNTVESSPKLALHAGSIPKSLGGMLSVDWTPYNTDAQAQFPGADISSHRFRFLANLAFQSPVKAKLMLTGRVGIGADIQHYSSSATILGTTYETSDTDVGIAFEVALGAWVKLGSVSVGGEAAVPISHHDKDNPNGQFDFKYDTYDLDILVGVRFLVGN